MRNKLTISLCLSLLLASCNNTPSENNDSLVDSITAVDSNIVANENIGNNDINSSNTIDDAILFPSTYRLDSDSELKELLASKKWKEIYKKDGKYFIGNALVELSTIEEDPCSGYPAQKIVSKQNGLILFDIPNIQDAAIDTVALGDSMIQPGKPFSFSFKGKKYRLEGSGITFYGNNGSNPKGDYTLKLFSENDTKGKVIHYQDEYNDTSTQLIMITDLDNDGLPDFVLSSPGDYEEERFLIILSSTNKAYVGDRQFDC